MPFRKIYMYPFLFILWASILNEKYVNSLDGAKKYPHQKVTFQTWLDKIYFNLNDETIWVSIHKNLSFMSFLIFKIFLQNKYDTKEHGIQQRT